MTFDKNAVGTNEIAVKLRHGPTNAKLPRTPFNIESAIAALINEVSDLYGRESLDRVLTEITREMWESDRAPSDSPSDHRISMGVELLVNNYGTASDDMARPLDNAVLIVQEIADIFEDTDFGRDLADLLAKHQA